MSGNTIDVSQQLADALNARDAAAAKQRQSSGLNDPQPPARQPRLRILADGKPLAGAISATVTSNSYFQADRFSCEFATSAGPPGWWDVEPPLLLDIRLSLDDGQSWRSLIIGEVDHMTVGLEVGTITMEGRDLSARLIEAKTREAFVNQTASQVVTAIAIRHGLNSHVAVTHTLIGRYYETDHQRVTLDQFSRTTTEWDLICYLAQREGFDVFMDGMTINFSPPAPPNAEPFKLRWVPPGPVPRLNAIRLRMERSLAIAKDVEVIVKSYGSREGIEHQKTALATAKIPNVTARARAPKKPTTKQQFVIVRANLTPEQAQALAEQTAREITAHERVVNVEMAGELILTARNMVRLSGTGTSFDQSYFVKSLERSISFHEGFTQSLRLSNTSPRDITVT